MDLITMLKTMLDGMGGTCAIFFLTLLFALPLGMVVALLRMSKVKVISSITRAVISVLRGTPLMLQLIAVTYGPYYLFELPVAKNKRILPRSTAAALNLSLSASTRQRTFWAIPRSRPSSA